MISVAVEALGSQEASAFLGSAYFLTSIKMSNKISNVKFKLFNGNHLLTIFWEVIPVFCCLPTPNSFKGMLIDGKIKDGSQLLSP